jgi:ABC transporter DrrB family efflux protein
MTAAVAAPDRDRTAFASAVAAIAGRGFRTYLRTPQLFVFGTVAGAIFLLLFRYILGGSINVPAVAYVDYLVPGFVVANVLFVGTNVTVGVAADRDSGVADRFRSLPIPRLAVPFGRVIGDLAVLVPSTAAMVLLGYAVGFRSAVPIADLALAVLICLIAGFAFLWVFVLLGAVAGGAQAAQGMSMLAWPFVFVSTAYVRADSLPGWMQPFAEHQPVSVMANAVRSLALGDPQAAGLGHSTAYWVTMAFAWAVALTVIFGGLCARAFRR